MTKIIKLSGIRGKGKECLVDDGDYEYLNQFSWYVSKKDTHLARTILKVIHGKL